MWDRGWELPSPSAPSSLQTGLKLLRYSLRVTSYSSLLLLTPHIPLQVHHCGGARLECVGLPVRLHLLSIRRSQRLRCGDHALQRQRRYGPLQNLHVMLRNRPGSAGVLEGAKHPRTKSKSPSVKAVRMADLANYPQHYGLRSGECFYFNMFLQHWAV